MKLRLILLVIFFYLKLTYGQTTDALFISENIVIHTDRDEYIAGENVWIKIYNINEKGSFSDLSKIIYIEVISPKGYSVNRKKFKIEEGRSYGHIVLPDSLATNIYKIIAYTNWSKNNSSNQYFEREIFVFNPHKKGNLTFKQEDHIVKKDHNTSSEKVVLNDNQSINKQILITDHILYSTSKDSVNGQTKKELISISNVYINYDEISSLSDSVVKRKISIEEDKSDGYLLLPDSTTTNIYKVRIDTIGSKHNGILLNSESNILVFNPSCNGNLGLSQVNTFNRDSSLGSENIKSTSNTQDEKRQIEDEVESQNKQNKIRISNVKENYQTREEVAIKLNILEDNDSFKKAYLSISVKKIPDERSSAFFELKDRPKFGNMKGKVLYEPEYKGVLLSGRIMTQKGNVLTNRIIYLCFPDSIINIQSTKTDSLGNFKFYLEIDKPLKDIVIYVSNSQEKLMIQFNDNYLNSYKEFKPYKSAAFNLDERYLTNLYLNLRISKIFKNDIVESSENNEVIEKFNFYGQADEIYYFENYNRLDSIAEYIYEIIASVKVRRENGGLSINILDPRTYKFYNYAPAIFINGVMYEDPKFLLGLDPQNCDRIEVVRSPVLIKDKVYYGLVGIFTKSANLNGIDLQDNSVAFEYQVYNESTVFDFKGNYNLNKPDFRNTLYWEPNIVLKKSEEKTIEFYSSDDNSKYEIVVQGITDNGAEIYSRKVFEVIK